MYGFTDGHLRPALLDALLRRVDLKTCHPLKRKYITYRNDAEGGPSHSHRQQAQKFGKDSACVSGDMLADRGTDTHTHKYAHHNTSQPLPRGEVKCKYE